MLRRLGAQADEGTVAGPGASGRDSRDVDRTAVHAGGAADGLDRASQSQSVLASLRVLQQQGGTQAHTSALCVCARTCMVRTYSKLAHGAWAGDALKHKSEHLTQLMYANRGGAGF